MVEPLRHRQTKGAGNRYVLPNATAPHLDSTNRDTLTVGRSLPVCLQLRTYRCTARTDVTGQDASAVLALARKASSALMSSPASRVNRGLAKAVMISFCLWDATSP
jgi:hypothetical protein